MEKLYKPLSLRNAPLLFVSRESAELAKYAANAFLALKVSFINEVADLCEAVGADVQQVATAIGKDRRIGDKFLHPGPGYGGSCFPKDVSALIRTGREHKAAQSIIEQVERVNTERKIAMAGRIEHALGGSVRGKTIAILGVTFKPSTDDMRDAASLVIIPMLQERGAIVRAYDHKDASRACRCCRVRVGARTRFRLPEVLTRSWCSPNGMSSVHSTSRRPRLSWSATRSLI